MMTIKDYALHYYDNSLIPIPLCWTVKGRCACFMHHTDPKQIGKAPLVKYRFGQKEIPVTRGMVAQWFEQCPKANIGILIQQSGLVIVDADSAEAVEEIESIINPSIVPHVQTGRGRHYYFKRKTTTPLYRATHKGKSGGIDILSHGLIVAPPSTHMNGHSYQWLNPPKKVGFFPDVPEVFEKYLLPQTVSAEVEYRSLSKIEKIDLDSLPLNDFIKDIIRRGKDSPYYAERYTSSKDSWRSEAIFGVITACLKKELTDEQIVSIFSNPQNRITEKIFAQRKKPNWILGEIKRAKKAMAMEAKKNSRSPKRPLHMSSRSLQAKENSKGIN